MAASEKQTNTKAVKAKAMRGIVGSTADTCITNGPTLTPYPKSNIKVIPFGKSHIQRCKHIQITEMNPKVNKSAILHRVSCCCVVNANDIIITNCTINDNSGGTVNIVHK